MDVVAVHVYRDKTLVETKDFREYSKALDYAKKKSWLGFNCLVLRLINNNVWVKLWINSQLT